MHNLVWRDPIFPAEVIAPYVPGPDYTSIAISAVVSVVIFWSGYALNSAAARRERQRKVIEDWLRTLAEWVDNYARPTSHPEYKYNSLTNREVIELSLRRKERYLAWWMHEMAVAILLRRRSASKSLELTEGSTQDLNDLLRETGEYLLRWHHKELKSSDFHYPYQLRVVARSNDKDPHEYAHSRGLDAYPKTHQNERCQKIALLEAARSTSFGSGRIRNARPIPQKAARRHRSTGSHSET